MVNERIYPISIALLCGGKSKRFEGNKITYRIGEKRMFETVFDKFKDYSDEVFLQMSPPLEAQGKDEDTSPEVDWSGFPINYDVLPGKGPLGGIHSALTFAKYDRTFVIAADLPFIDKRILEELVKHTGYDIVVPKWENEYLEPLCALYSKDLAGLIEQRIGDGKLGVTRLCKLSDKINIKYLDIEKMIKQRTLDKDCFKNINYLEDIKNG
jgi:molybdopterin-guanine dinucleotide biosynthesis protein A